MFVALVNRTFHTIARISLDSAGFLRWSYESPDGRVNYDRSPYPCDSEDFNKMVYEHMASNWELIAVNNIKQQHMIQRVGGKIVAIYETDRDVITRVYNCDNDLSESRTAKKTKGLFLSMCELVELMLLD